ncbi:unnamed protein product [Meloidogyne enterolobii]|uniref:Uncharacterized protein n=1 Tax=Meloidogyne enterolobii TaxID=390850 RepID=A0ACB0ZPE0_MELEN
MDKKEELDRQRSLFLSLLEALSKHLDEGSSDKEADTKIDKGMMMVQEGEKKNDEGKKKNEEGKDMIAKGLKLVEEGNKLVEEGNKLVEEGNKLVESGNKSVDEGNQMKQSIKKNNITKGMLDEIRACAYELFGVKDSRQLSIFGNVQPTQDQGKEDKRVVVWELENLMSSDDAASYKECMKMVKNRGHLNLIVSNKSITEITEDLIVNDMSEYVQPENGIHNCFLLLNFFQSLVLSKIFMLNLLKY